MATQLINSSSLHYKLGQSGKSSLPTGLIPRTLGPSNDFPLLNSWICLHGVRLSRLPVGFRTHFKSLHFHSLIHFKTIIEDVNFRHRASDDGNHMLCVSQYVALFHNNNSLSVCLRVVKSGKPRQYRVLIITLSVIAAVVVLLVVILLVAMLKKRADNNSSYRIFSFSVITIFT